jgi:thermitase
VASLRQASMLLGTLAGVLALVLVQANAWGQLSGPFLDGEPLDTDDGTEYVAGQLIVTYEEGVTGARTNDLIDAAEGEVERDLDALDADVVVFPDIRDDAHGAVRERKLADAKETLEDTPGIESVDYDYIRHVTARPDPDSGFEPDDGLYSQQWGLDKPHFPAAWQRTTGEGDGILVAVVDTGIAQDHEDFRYARPTLPPGEQQFPGESEIRLQKDFVDDDPVAQNSGGHGTHVAGTVAAATDNGIGVAGGCPGCDLIVGKALTERGGSDSDVASAITWAVDGGADVINLSLGAPYDSNVLRNAVDDAHERGAVVVAAAGNGGTRTVMYPAAYPNVIAVAATNASDGRAGFSNYGGWVDVAAPGKGILSTVPSSADPYRSFSGTSMASPHVAALAGLLLDAADATPATPPTNSEVRSYIMSSARDLGKRGRDPLYGAGRIRANAALTSATAPP